MLTEQFVITDLSRFQLAFRRPDSERSRIFGRRVAGLEYERKNVVATLRVPLAWIANFGMGNSSQNEDEVREIFCPEKVRGLHERVPRWAFFVVGPVSKVMWAVTAPTTTTISSASSSTRGTACPLEAIESRGGVLSERVSDDELRAAGPNHPVFLRRPAS
jgi:hypothetical protein